MYPTPHASSYGKHTGKFDSACNINVLFNLGQSVATLGFTNGWSRKSSFDLRLMDKLMEVIMLQPPYLVSRIQYSFTNLVQSKVQGQEVFIILKTTIQVLESDLMRIFGKIQQLQNV